MSITSKIKPQLYYDILNVYFYRFLNFCLKKIKKFLMCGTKALLSTRKVLQKRSSSFNSVSLEYMLMPYLAFALKTYPVSQP